MQQLVPVDRVDEVLHRDLPQHRVAAGPVQIRLVQALHPQDRGLSGGRQVSQQRVRGDARQASLLGCVVRVDIETIHCASLARQVILCDAQQPLLGREEVGQQIAHRPGRWPVVEDRVPLLVAQAAQDLRRFAAAFAQPGDQLGLTSIHREDLESVQTVTPKLFGAIGHADVEFLLDHLSVS